MKYVILAAGKGTRLHPVTHTIPKPLVSLLNRKSILEHEICNASKTGFFDEIIVITGYREDMIRHAVSQIECPIKITCVHNENWQSPSPLFSLHAIARTIRQHDVVITNGDTVHTQKFFNIFRIKHPVEDIRLFVSVANAYQPDDMRVMFSKNNDRIIKISKTLSYDETHGVSTGMLLLKGLAKRTLFLSHLEKLVSENDIKPYWHAIVDQLVGERVAVNFSFVPYDAWYEVDSIEDLIQANKLI